MNPFGEFFSLWLSLGVICVILVGAAWLDRYFR
jgi:hypothetical protein